MGRWEPPDCFYKMSEKKKGDKEQKDLYEQFKLANKKFKRKEWGVKCMEKDDKAKGEDKREREIYKCDCAAHVREIFSRYARRDKMKKFPFAEGLVTQESSDNISKSQH